MLTSIVHQLAVAINVAASATRRREAGLDGRRRPNIQAFNNAITLDDDTKHRSWRRGEQREREVHNMTLRG